VKLRLLDERLAICRLDPTSPPPAWAVGRLVSLTRTDHELTVVCASREVPPGIHHEAPYRALQVEGPFDLSETGVLSALSAPLAEAGVPLFAVSTYDTDYLLVPDGDLVRAEAALRGAGHEVAA
jgi:hypothetical protein